MKKKLLFLILISISAHQLIGQNMFKEGEALLLDNRLSDAAVMFEAVIDQDPANSAAYLYLGYIYEVKQDYNSAVMVLSQGLTAVDRDQDKFYFNIANNYFKDGDYKSAAEMYSKAVRSRTGFAEPYLNRANCRVKTEEYSLAVRDYRLYLNMKPAAPQRSSIEKMISMLELTIVEDEKRREDDERRRLTEAARQKALLDSVLNSLSNAGSDTTNLSAESENIEDIELELDIED
ncbi:MAG: tetratricopeptide repeat protein [Spirochaetales bacterium]|nr:tetratricopeptide repeat protein [Spirochaetales bacterium]